MEAIGFDVFMDEALYGSDGFYAAGRGAGRKRDFITSPELGPLFGAVIARAFAAWGVHRVVEAGAGSGALRDAILAVSPALEYVTVEFADAWPAGDADVVIANELLDNLPFKIVDREGTEVLVADGGFVPASGEWVPRHTRAIEWVARAKATAPRVVAFDYGVRTTEDLVGRTWLRTYREHTRGDDPLRHIGEQDITTDVAFDQLAPDRLTTQADWLREHGIDDLVAGARATWTERAAIGDLAALKARARVHEAEALLDPAGLGGFLVAEWIRP